MKRRRVFLSRDRQTAHVESCPVKGKSRPYEPQVLQTFERTLADLKARGVQLHSQCLPDGQQEMSA